MYSKTTNKTDASLKLEKLIQAKEYIRAIDHELRLDIIEFLDKNPKCFVKTIYKSLDTEQSIISQQLRILKSADIVTDERSGKNVMYSLNYERLSIIQKAIDSFMNK